MTGPPNVVIFRLALTDRPVLLSVNEEVEVLLGYTIEDFQASRVKLGDLVHAHDAGIAEALYSKEIRENSGTIHLRLRQANGLIRLVKGEFGKEIGKNGEVLLELRLQDSKSLCLQNGAPEFPENVCSMLENTEDYLYFKDLNHIFTSASRTVAALLNLGEDGAQVLGKVDYDFFPERDADVFYRLEKEIYEGSSGVHLIQEMARKTGGTIWLDNRKYPLKNKRDELVGLWGIARDITQLRLAEKTLQASESSLKEAQRIAGLGSFVQDLRTGQWSGSEVLDEIFGIDKEYDHNGEAQAALMHPDDRAMVMEYFRAEVLEQGKLFDKEYRIVRPADGATRWVHSLGIVDLDTEGNTLHFRGTVQDITGRKLAEDVLRESEESLNEAQRIAGVGSYFMNIQRGEWRSSEVLDGILGVDRSYPHTYEGWKPLVYPADRAMMEDYFTNEVIGQGKNFDKEYRIVRPSDRAVRWVHGLGRLDLDSQGRLVAMHGTIQDITERVEAESALRESKELLQQFIEHAPASLAMFDRDMRHISVSQRWIEVHNLAGMELIGRSHYETNPYVPERWREAHRRGLAGETVRSSEDRYVWEDGRVQWWRWELMPWRTGSGEVGGIVIVTEDITREKEAEERQRLAVSVFAHAREAIMITTPGGVIIDVNAMFTEITGYTREEVLGRNPNILSSGRHKKIFYTAMWRAIQETGQWSGEIWNRRKDGRNFPEMLTISAVCDESGKVQHYVALFSDISAIKEYERHLERIAQYDVLTGLPNRSLLASRLRAGMDRLQRNDGRMAVAYLDLDKFKAVNDRHGHDVGDRLLTALAHRMKLVLRSVDTLARLGGDEFVAVLLDLANVEASTPVLSRLLEAASEPIRIGDIDIQVSASVGVAFFRRGEDVDAEQLLRQADQAMYQAKLAGKNRYHIFDSSHDRSVRGHHEDLERIRTALSGGEFVLYYQPKVNMKTGAVVGAEALVRWQDPERGLLPPSAFLPAIEDHSLAVDLGEWVIATALSQMEEWRQNGLDLPVSVNVSARQLQHADFTDRLADLLRAYPHIDPSHLELEILETSALQDLDRVSRILKDCRAFGVIFALDDFGTGYSSLTYLKQLPAQILKVDQSFVRDILDDPEALTLLEGVLGLATAFRRQLIAEGVETVEHGLMLLRMGCELAQGYGIARPLPASELPGWAARWRPNPRWKDAVAASADTRQLLYATVELRSWIASIGASLKQDNIVFPVWDESRPSVWMAVKRLARDGAPPELQEMEDIYGKAHTLAEQIHVLHSQGRRAEGVARWTEMEALGSRLIEALDACTVPVN